MLALDWIRSQNKHQRAEFKSTINRRIPTPTGYVMAWTVSIAVWHIRVCVFQIGGAHGRDYMNRSVSFTENKSPKSSSCPIASSTISTSESSHARTFDHNLIFPRTLSSCAHTPELSDPSPSLILHLLLATQNRPSRLPLRTWRLTPRIRSGPLTKLLLKMEMQHLPHRKKCTCIFFIFSMDLKWIGWLIGLLNVGNLREQARQRRRRRTLATPRLLTTNPPSWKGHPPQGPF